MTTIPQPNMASAFHSGPAMRSFTTGPHTNAVAPKRCGARITVTAVNLKFLRSQSELFQLLQ